MTNHGGRNQFRKSYNVACDTLLRICRKMSRNKQKMKLTPRQAAQLNDLPLALTRVLKRKDILELRRLFPDGFQLKARNNNHDNTTQTPMVTPTLGPTETKTRKRRRRHGPSYVPRTNELKNLVAARYLGKTDSLSSFSSDEPFTEGESFGGYFFASKYNYESHNQSAKPTAGLETEPKVIEMEKGNRVKPTKHMYRCLKPTCIESMSQAGAVETDYEPYINKEGKSSKKKKNGKEAKTGAISKRISKSSKDTIAKNEALSNDGKAEEKQEKGQQKTEKSVQVCKRTSDNGKALKKSMTIPTVEQATVQLSVRSTGQVKAKLPSETKGSTITKPTSKRIAQSSPETKATTISKPTSEMKARSSPETKASTITKPISKMIVKSSSETKASTITKPTSKMIAQSSPETKASTITKPISEMIVRSSPETKASTITKPISEMIVRSSPETKASTTTKPISEINAKYSPETKASTTTKLKKYFILNDKLQKLFSSDKKPIPPASEEHYNLVQKKAMKDRFSTKKDADKAKQMFRTVSSWTTPKNITNPKLLNELRAIDSRSSKRELIQDHVDHFVCSIQRGQSEKNTFLIPADFTNISKEVNSDSSSTASSNEIQEFSPARRASLYRKSVIGLTPPEPESKSDRQLAVIVLCAIIGLIVCRFLIYWSVSFKFTLMIVLFKLCIILFTAHAIKVHLTPDE